MPTLFFGKNELESVVKPLNPRLLRTLQGLSVFAVAIVSLCSSSQAGDQVHRSGSLARNTHAFGEIEKLLETSLSLADQRCFDSSCSSSLTGPIRISFQIPSYGPVQIEITKLKVPSTVVESSDGRIIDTTGTLPVLFQGRVRLRHTIANGAKWYPTAGTLFRRPGASQLEFVIPQVNRKSRKVHGRFDLVRVPLKQFRVLNDHLNARLVKTIGKGRTACANSSSVSATEIAPAIRPPSGSTSGSKVSINATRVVNIAVQADFQYKEKLGDDAHDRIISTINAVDAIYDPQLNVEIHLSKISIQTSASQPFASTNSSTLLSQFQSSNNSTNRLGTADGFMLATGKEIDGNVIGLAFVGVVCADRTSSYGLYQRQSDARDIATAAHELGHNFGAVHTALGGIMAAVLSSIIPTTFTDDSVAQVSTHLNQFYSGCLGQKVGGVTPSTPTPTPRPTSTPTRTPTPRPTSTPGGPPPPTSTPGDGSGGDNSGGDGQDLGSASLAAQLAKNGEVTLTVGFDNTENAACEATVFGGITPILARSMTLQLASGDVSDGNLTVTGSVTGSAIKKPSKTPVRVHFYTRVKCSGIDVADSEVFSVNTKKINVSRPKSGRVLFPVANWLKRLKTSATTE